MDWRRRDWVGLLYPPDMPEDWWLSFYNTQFRCVWLAVPAWTGISLDEARQWLEDTDIGFRFVLEVPPAPDAHASAILDVLAARIVRVGAPTHPDLVWFTADSDVRRLAETIAARGEGEPPLYLISQDGDLAALERVGTLLHLLGV